MAAENDFVVHHVPKEFRPIQECSKDDVVLVTSVRESFMYIIPSFDVIVERRSVEIKGNSRKDGIEQCYHLFICNSLSLSTECPFTIIIKDVTVIKVIKSIYTTILHMLLYCMKIM